MSTGVRKNARKQNEPRVSEKALKIIRDHIKNFCRYKSHFSDIEFVLCVDDVEEMYSLYKKQCEDKNVKAQKIEIYRDMVLNREFKIKFVLPIHPSCPVCSSEQNKTVIDEHKTEFGEVCKEYERDLKDCKGSGGDKVVVTMNMYPPQPLPVIRETDDNFVRNRYQMLVYNFVLHNSITSDVHVCQWPEYLGSCGVDEVASCILKMLPTVLEGNKKVVKELIVWTDSHVINKNYTMIFLWIYVLSQHMGLEKITHKYFPAGHPEPMETELMETDKAFKHIAKKMNTMQCVWTPHDWIRVIENSKKKGKAFKVVDMNTSDICSMVSLNKRFVKRETLYNGTDAFNIAELTAVEVTNAHPGIVGVKTINNNSYYSSLSVLKRNKFPILHLMVLGPKYPKGRKLSRQVLSDLMVVLNYVPYKDCRYFEKLEEERRPDDGDEDDEDHYIDEEFKD